MAGCKLTSNITKENCAYAVAGVKTIYLINYDTDNKYTINAETMAISAITLAGTGTKAYKVDFINGTASWSDELAENGNSGKYRTHTLNFNIDKYDYDILNQGKALSLGKFTAVVVDKSGENGKGRAVMLGRINGLSATAMNYASGAADADAMGWTVTMAGTETEIGLLLEDEKAVKDLVEGVPVVTP